MSDEMSKFDWASYTAGYLASLEPRTRIRTGGEEEQAALVDLHDRMQSLEGQIESHEQRLNATVAAYKEDC